MTVGRQNAAKLQLNEHQNRIRNLRLLKGLPIPKARHDLRQLSIGSFETISDAVAEDQARVRRHFRGDCSSPAFSKALSCLAPGRTSGSLASAKFMHHLRTRMCGELLRVFEKYRDRDIVSATILNGAASFPIARLKFADVAAQKKQMRDHLDRSGVTRAPGLLFGALEGEFCAGKFQLHFHFIVAGEKIAALEALRSMRSYRPSDAVKRPIMIKKLTDRHGAFPYCLKMFWKAKRTYPHSQTGAQVKTARSFRMDINAEAAYLELLHSISLTDIVILQNMRFGKDGLKLLKSAVEHSANSKAEV